MSVQGVQTLTDDGEPVFLDSERTVPLIENIVLNEINGSQLATFAFSRTFGNAAGGLLAVAVLLFAFSTVIGWSSFGSQAAAYLFGKKAATPFRCAFIAVTLIGSVCSVGMVWDICDMINGLLCVPNLLALFLLSPKVFAITRNYCRRTFIGESIRPMLSADATLQQEFERQ